MILAQNIMGENISFSQNLQEIMNFQYPRNFSKIGRVFFPFNKFQISMRLLPPQKKKKKDEQIFQSHPKIIPEAEQGLCFWHKRPFPAFSCPRLSTELCHRNIITQIRGGIHLTGAPDKWDIHICDTQSALLMNTTTYVFMEK